MKQCPPGTEIDIFRQDPNDWRCQSMWNGCKKLRQLCISSTQYDACAAYVHATGINTRIAAPPDNACIALWQPDQLDRIWVCLRQNAIGKVTIRSRGIQSCFPPFIMRRLSSRCRLRWILQISDEPPQRDNQQPPDQPDQKHWRKRD